MDDWNEINESLGAQLGGKYSYTSANGGIYYHWNKSNDRKLNKPDFNWNGYFDIPEPINYKSSHRPNGKTEKVQFPGSKKHGIEPVIKEIPQSEPTGYLTPRFSFINIQINRYGFKGEEYKQALETFGISENGTIPPEKLPVISNYRDTILKQLHRQAEQLNEWNQEISNVLKVYYYESEQAILKGNPDEEIEQRVKDRSNVLRNIRNLFEALILSGAKTELIERHSLLEKLKENKYIPEHLIDTTIHGVLTLSKKKDPIIDMAVQLAHKINPLESILEDAFLNDRVKPKIQFELDERFKQLPEPETVADKFCNREENKAGKYDSEIITTALKIVRNYIFDEQLDSINRKVRTISKEVKNQSDILNKTDLKTIDGWVKFYWNEYKPDQAQTEH
ncbi:hypothetical protein [Gracilimonas mengyeensis]|uniref:Uncharacterized protein n=1 Tax=Gracilimonas mengyeensis TaxID=1302730 RepID=A0A521F4D2_9BACT|nr:hypothetical protein [Gracilimonas mengyeensis]SMO91033.1 hypothetical protein SAMN06265219_11527 [Gracilimonas mengyeensis]